MSVLFYKQQFYASLRITADRIEVVPFDDEIDTIFFTESHLDGYKSIELEEAKQLDQTIRRYRDKSAPQKERATKERAT
jgi:hypothetical protein